MNYFSENEGLHFTAMNAEVPYAWRDYSSWRFISEISRRWPGRFRVFQCPYAGGLGDTSVWYLNERSEHELLGQPAIYVNNLGSITVARHNDDHGCELSSNSGDEVESKIATLDIMMASDLSYLLWDIESCFEGWSPAETPQTRKDTVGQRLIAECLGLKLHSTVQLRVTGFLYDGIVKREDLAGRFPQLSERDFADPDRRSQVFFVQESQGNPVGASDPGRTLFAVDLAEGILHIGNESIDLMQSYVAHERSISKLAWEMLSRDKFK
jgi:hypothetical protein